MASVNEIWAKNLGKLLERARSGDAGAIKALRDHYEPQLLARAVQLFGDEGSARAAVDKTFTKAFASLQYLKEEQSFEEWIGRILANEAALSKEKKVIPAQPVQPVQSAPVNIQDHGKKKGRGPLTALLIVLLVLAVGIGGTFLYTRLNGKLPSIIPGGKEPDVQPVEVLTRPAISAEGLFGHEEEITPAAEQYSSSLSDVINPNIYPNEAAYAVDVLGDEGRRLLEENYFVVRPADWGYEFYDVIMSNSSEYIPTFVTTDSLLHAYHQYYALLQKKIEKNYLHFSLLTMSIAMYEYSRIQQEELTGTAWEEAVKRNVDFYGIGARLLGAKAELSSAGEEELARILDASGVHTSSVLSAEEECTMDYSQFKPRGYYTEAEELEQYFRAMMWYGQANFARKSEELTRSAVLSVLAMNGEAYQEWSKIYSVTAFFAGESDDLGYSEYYPAVTAVYGEEVTLSDISEDEKKFEKLRNILEQFSSPAVNSVYRDTWDADTAGFRILGQRYTFDGYIIERLTNGVSQADKKSRSLPTGLDVPAALGSDLALKIAQDTTNISEYPSYTKELEKLRQADEDTYPCISSAWLSMIKTLLKQDGEGMPSFMQSEAWAVKKLNTFMGSYTELKHDTVLYHKEPWGGLGADSEILNVDDRGYVEPEADLYRRCAVLTETAISGLSSFGMLEEKDRANLQYLADTARKLQTISEKELRNELPTDEEFQFIRTGYAVFLYDIWYAAEIEPNPGTSTMTSDHPAALITDIAVSTETGDCLELAEGYPMEIYVIVSVEGKPRIAKGAVYSYYEFEYPADRRLNDDEWREMLKDGRVTAKDTAEWTRVSYVEYEATPLYSQSEPTYSILGSVTVKVTNLNSRSIPSTSGEKLPKVKDKETYTVYEIAYGEGYTWYRIGEDRWIADEDGKWVDFHPEG